MNDTSISPSHNFSLPEYYIDMNFQAIFGDYEHVQQYDRSRIYMIIVATVSRIIY